MTTQRLGRTVIPGGDHARTAIGDPWQSRAAATCTSAESPERTHSRRRVIGLIVGAADLPGCAFLPRRPAVPLALAGEAFPLHILLSRFYADGYDTAFNALVLEVARRRLLQARGGAAVGRGFAFLAISGGGDEGAFGAGLLVGWSARGDRPIFDVVTGVSTGALSAPFVFLGRDYDEQLERIFTETAENDVYVRRPILAALGQDALTDSAPLRRRIEAFLDRRMIERIAREYRKGRLLLVGTTNLASASIPGVFPPVMLDVSIGGERFQERHVDGGTVAQVFTYPPSLDVRRYDKKSAGKKRIYVIRNSRVWRPEESVDASVLQISAKVISTMTAASGVNDTYRIYLLTKRDAIEFHLAYIDRDFEVPYRGPFDQS